MASGFSEKKGLSEGAQSRGLTNLLLSYEILPFSQMKAFELSLVLKVRVFRIR